MGRISDIVKKIEQLDALLKKANVKDANSVINNTLSTSELSKKLIDDIDQKLKTDDIIRKASIDPFMLSLDASLPQFSISGAFIEVNVDDDPNKMSVEQGSFLIHNFYAVDRKSIKKIKSVYSYDPSRGWSIPQTDITLVNNNAYWIYIKIPINEELNSSEIFASEEHVDPLRDEGYIIYKHRKVEAVTGGVRTVSTQFGSSNYIAPHLEYDRLVNLASRTVNVAFKKPFAAIPTGWVKVYRMKQVSTGKWKQYDVLYYHTVENWLTNEGFSLQIETTEALAGIVILYEFK